MSYIQDTIKELRSQIQQRQQAIQALETLEDSGKPTSSRSFHASARPGITSVPKKPNPKRTWTTARRKKFQETMKAIKAKKLKEQGSK
jgi:hypothetical protein